MTTPNDLEPVQLGIKKHYMSSYPACASCAQVLLFSTMTRVLDVVEDYLDWRGFEHLRLDGAVSSADRGDLVQRFNAPGKLA